MANCMEQVAKMLGVKMGENFRFIDENGKESVGIYWFEKNGLISSVTLSKVQNVLVCLLTGKYTVKHVPYQPKHNDVYWRVGVYGSAFSEKWTGQLFDYNLYKLGNCYRTKEEAEANRDKWIDFYASDEVLEV